VDTHDHTHDHTPPFRYNPLQVHIQPDLDALLPLPANPLARLRALSARRAFLRRCEVERASLAAHYAAILQDAAPQVVAAEFGRALSAWGG
jgi:hypothetical protein